MTSSCCYVAAHVERKWSRIVAMILLIIEHSPSSLSRKNGSPGQRRRRLFPGYSAEFHHFPCCLVVFREPESLEVPSFSWTITYPSNQAGPEKGPGDL